MGCVKCPILRCIVGCPFHICKLLFGTGMYGYNVDPNPKKIIYGLNFLARHRVSVKQWEMAEFTIGTHVFFSPRDAEHYPLEGI